MASYHHYRSHLLRTFIRTCLYCYPRQVRSAASCNGSLAELARRQNWICRVIALLHQHGAQRYAGIYRCRNGRMRLKRLCPVMVQLTTDKD